MSRYTMHAISAPITIEKERERERKAYILMVQQLQIFRCIPALERLVGRDSRLDGVRVRGVERHDVEREVETRHAARVDVVLAIPRESLVDLVPLDLALHVHCSWLVHLQDSSQIHHVVHQVRVVFVRHAPARRCGAEAEGLPVW